MGRNFSVKPRLFMLINPGVEFGVLLTACQAASAPTGKHEAKTNAAQARLGSGSGDGLWVVVFLTEMRGNKREGVVWFRERGGRFACKT